MTDDKNFEAMTAVATRRHLFRHASPRQKSVLRAAIDVSHQKIFILLKLYVLKTIKAKKNFFFFFVKIKHILLIHKNPYDIFKLLAQLLARGSCNSILLRETKPFSSLLETSV